MKNINENILRSYIIKKLKESYFDDMEFDNDAMNAAKSDMENSGEEFEDLGTSKFEKDPKFAEKFKSSLKRANLELPSDEEEVEKLAQVIKRKNDHESKFGKGSLNETDVEYIKDAEGKPIRLKSPVQHESGVNGYVERFVVGDDKNMLVKVVWIQDPNSNKLNPVVSPEKLIVRENIKKENEETHEEEIEEGMGRSFTIGMNKNEKPEDYPEELMRESFTNEIHKLSFLDKIKIKLAKVSEEKALENLNNGLPVDYNENIEEDIERTDYDFNQAGFEHEREEEARKELGDEIYYVLDDEFNNANYPDLVGKTFSEKPADGVNIKKMDGKDEVEENSSDSLMNKHGKNSKPNTSHLQEDSENGDRYERIIFLQDHEADHALNILMQDGQDDAIEYLKQWHQDSHETSNEIGNGSSDKTYEKDGYILIWNSTLGYIGLVYDTDSTEKF